MSDSEIIEIGFELVLRGKAGIAKIALLYRQKSKRKNLKKSVIFADTKSGAE